MPNKTVLFHTSENSDVSVYVQRTSHKGAPYARSEVGNATEGMVVCMCVCDEYGVQAIYITIKCVHSCTCTCFVKTV